MKVNDAPIRPRDTESRGFRLAVAIVALAAALLMFINSGFFVLRAVEVTGCRHLTRAEVLMLAGLDRPVNTLRVSPQAVCENLERDPRIATAVVARRLPGTFIVQVTEREPLFALDYRGNEALVGADGVVLATGSGNQIPRVTGVECGELRTGQRIREPLIQAACGFLRSASPSLLARATRLDLSTPSQITLHLSGSIAVILGGTEDARRKIEALDLLLADCARRNRKPSVINLSVPESPTVRWAND